MPLSAQFMFFLPSFLRMRHAYAGIDLMEPGG